MMQDRVQKRLQLDKSDDAILKRARVALDREAIIKDEPTLVHISHRIEDRLLQRSTLLAKNDDLEEFLLSARRFFVIEEGKDVYLVMIQGTLEGTEVSKDAWNTEYIRKNAWCILRGVEKYELRVRDPITVVKKNKNNAAQGCENALPAHHRVNSNDEHVSCVVKGKGFPILHVKMKRTTRLDKLMKAYCSQSGFNSDTTRFTIDGHQIAPLQPLEDFMEGREQGEQVQVDVHAGIVGGWY